ncbi:anthranilate phosphoribosyltransferase [Thermoproteota archaeon]
MLESYINLLKSKTDLTQDQSYDCLSKIFTGEAAQPEIESLLILFREKSESVSEIVGFATAMREKMLTVTLPRPAIDLCGTGGMLQDRFNVSTAAAFVLGAIGIPTAKHGNRGSRKPNGSFDFLEALAIPFELSIEKIQEIFDKTEICFLFARQFHKAMGAVAQARKSVGGRTIFNLLGPLCNPAKVKRQIIGVVNEQIAVKLAEACRQLGTDRTLVIAGAEGMDELNLEGVSIVFDVTADTIKRFEFNPLAAGLYSAGSSSIPIGDAKQNAALFIDLFSNARKDHNISRLIALNCGAAAYCWGNTSSIEQGAGLAAEAIGSGAAWDKFVQYRSLAQKEARQS